MAGIKTNNTFNENYVVTFKIKRTHQPLTVLSIEPRPVIAYLNRWAGQQKTQSEYNQKFDISDICHHPVGSNGFVCPEEKEIDRR